MNPSSTLVVKTWMLFHKLYFAEHTLISPRIQLRIYIYGVVGYWMK